jgi:predicted nucleotidyltransferase
MKRKKITKKEAIRIIKEFIPEILEKENWYGKIKEYIKAVVLYGSVAKGKNRPDSDIDFLIILPLEIEEKYTKGEYFFQFNNREINIVLRSIETLRKLAKEQNDAFQSEVFSDSEIIWEKDKEVRDLIEKIIGVKP